MDMSGILNGQKVLAFCPFADNMSSNPIDKKRIKMSTQTPAKSRLGFERHATNPFMDATAMATHTRNKRITNTSGDKMMVIGDTGEVIGAAGFWTTTEVDKTQFIKLYINGVKAFKELTSPGTRVFEVLYTVMQQNIGRDEVILAYSRVDQSITPMSAKTFTRGTKELLEKNFIAEGLVPNVYYINPDYVFNGNRLTLVHQYREREQSAREIMHSKNLDLFNAEQNQRIMEIAARDALRLQEIRDTEEANQSFEELTDRA